jgi:hypothetical protein
MTLAVFYWSACLGIIVGTLLDWSLGKALVACVPLAVAGLVHVVLERRRSSE